MTYTEFDIATHPTLWQRSFFAMLEVISFQSFLDVVKFLFVLLNQLATITLPELHVFGTVLGKYKSFVVHYVVVHHLGQSYI